MINLFINYYVDKSAERQAEIDLCLINNLNNKLLNVVVLENQNRLKYNDYFKIINDYADVEDINIISNSDIYFDESIGLVSKLQLNQVFALARWDLLADGTVQHFNRKDSQDCWIFRGKINREINGDFYLGYRGCDNRIAHEFLAVGYKVSNPSLDIKSYHVHNTNIRNYTTTSAEFLVPGPYLTIAPERFK